MKGNNSIQLCTSEMKEAAQLWVNEKFKDPAPRVKDLKYHPGSSPHAGQPIFVIILEEDDKKLCETQVEADGLLRQTIGDMNKSELAESLRHALAKIKQLEAELLAWKG